jgi:hypothetical protein
MTFPENAHATCAGTGFNDGMSKMDWQGRIKGGWQKSRRPSVAAACLKTKNRTLAHF